ncbi:MAG: hypothetical protein ACKVU0_13460 [Saprospiraceae bacterium]
MNESLFSKIIVTVLGGVATFIIIEMIKPSFSREPAPTKQESASINHSTNRPSNLGDNNSARQYPNNSTLSNPQGQIEAKKEEDYSNYINSSLSRANVSVIIIDASGNLSTPASSSIAEVYQKAGKSTSVGLIRSSFIRKPEFQELCEGNSEIIQKLSLGAYTDYLAIGKINFANRAGKLVDGTIICTASISMSIISTSTQSLKNSFAISNASGNGATESQAKEDALQKLLDKYYNEHSSL